MKIISWNVRGLGSFEKRREVCHLVREKNLFIICVQETKLFVIDVNLCTSIWGGDLVDFSFQPSVGASGGIVTMWDTREVEVWSSMSFEHVLAISGCSVKTGVLFTVFNVYAPCDFVHQQVFGIIYQAVCIFYLIWTCVCVVTLTLSGAWMSGVVLVAWLDRVGALPTIIL